MTEPNLNGPESVPLREYIKSFPLIVTIFDNDKVVREEKVDYSDKTHRQWIGKVTVWAITNGYTVETRRNDGA